MRLLLLNPIGQIGGAERVLLTLIEGIRATRADVQMHLVALDDGPLCERARALGVDVTVIQAGALRELGDSGARERGKLGLAARAVVAAPTVWSVVRQLRAAIAQLAPDVIHSNGIKTHLLAGLARPQAARVVWHVHDFIGDRPIVGKLLRRVITPAVIPVAVSQAVAEDVRHWLGGSPVRTILNGIDTARFSPGARGDEIDRLAGRTPAPDVLRVGLVGTYARWKGQDVFLRAVAGLLEQTRSARAAMRFYIVGGPIYSTAGSQYSVQELSDLAASLRVGDGLAFVPFQSDLVPVYRSLDVVVQASTRREPFGLTIAEAMACGRAVIATQTGGAAELFTDGRDALGVRPGDVSALAAAIVRLAKDPALRDLLARHARATALERFDSKRLTEQMLQAYQTP
jgi:glycosyltransferase involved in cell wall biosynthesis